MSGALITPLTVWLLLGCSRRKLPAGHGRLRQHIFQDALESHRVAAHTTRFEEAAIAGPLIILKGDGVGVVLTLNGYGKRGELDAVALFSVAFRLLDLANHPIIHVEPPHFLANTALQ